MLQDTTLDISTGDRVRVTTRVKEGNKDRIQVFEGRVIRIRGKNENRTFTVRKLSKGNFGVERTWPIRSPHIDSVEVIDSVKVRRSKLYFLRDRIGKAAQLKSSRQ